MHKVQRVVIVAGEASGDIHAAKLIRLLKAQHPHIEVSGIGGTQMQDAGATLIYDLARYGVTGFTEIIRYFKIIRQAFHAIKKHLKQQKPDLLILVDYPGFNLRLAKYAKRTLGLKIIYYISPQIWAWKANRIHLIKECVDKMAVILPFEKPIYTQAQVPVHFVGHPLVEELSLAAQGFVSKETLGLPKDKPIIALLPGSRTNEIERHMPILKTTVSLLNRSYPELHFVIPIAQTIAPEKVYSYFPQSHPTITFIQGKAMDCMAAADFVVVASGTASLECALLGKPMCIIYKSSFLTYLAAMSLIKVKFLGLCNLLMNKMIVPEFLQYDCNPIELSKYISKVYEDPSLAQKIKQELFALKDSLSNDKSDCSLIELIEDELAEINA